MINKNLYSRYKEILNNINVNYQGRDINKIFDNYVDFIREKFQLREKGRAFQITNTKFDLFDKGKHEVSVYLLGCLLKKVIWDNLNKFIRNRIEPYSPSYNFDFEYLWSLTSVYHDITSKKERNHENKIKELKNSNDIVKCIQDNDFDISENLYDKDRKLPLYHTYGEEIVVNYMNMRLQEGNGALDHGIVAGFLLYDALVDNYHIQFSKSKAKCEDDVFITECNFNNAELIWHPFDLWVYGYIADAIVAHNIWFCNTDNDESERYKRYELDNLIVQDGVDNRLSIDKNPLAFFLGLIDTIEPVKRFADLNVKETLKDIYIDYKDSVITIYVGEKITDEGFKKYLKNIVDMEMWLKVETEQRNREIEIKILRNNSVSN